MQRVATRKRHDAAPVLFGRAASAADPVRRLVSLNAKLAGRAAKGRGLRLSITPKVGDWNMHRVLRVVVALSLIVGPSATANPAVGVVLRRVGIWLAEEAGAWAYGKLLDKAIGAGHEKQLRDATATLDRAIASNEAQARLLARESSERHRLQTELLRAQREELAASRGVANQQLALVRRMQTSVVSRAEAERERNAIITSLRRLDLREEQTRARVTSLEQRVAALERRPDTRINVSTSVRNTTTITIVQPPTFWERRRARGLVARGERLLAADELERAIETFSDSIGLDDSNSAAYEGRARAFRRSGDIKHALTDISEACRRRDSVDLLLERGDLRALTSDWTGAERDYSAVIANRSRAWDVYVKRASAYRALGNSVAARADLLTVVERGAGTPAAALARLDLLRATSKK